MHFKVTAINNTSGEHFTEEVEVAEDDIREAVRSMMTLPVEAEEVITNGAVWTVRAMQIEVKPEME